MHVGCKWVCDQSGLQGSWQGRLMEMGKTVEMLVQVCTDLVSEPGGRFRTACIFGTQVIPKCRLSCHWTQ